MNLTDEHISATALYLSIKKMLGVGVTAWEPESVWLELSDLGVDIPSVNRDKLLAVVTLLATGSFYWDAAVYENTAVSFDHKWSSPEILQEASPAQLSWAVFEANYLRHHEGLVEGDFDYEPARYTAVSLYRAGFIVAPELLEFAQEELDKLNRGHLELRDSIKSRWAALPKEDISSITIEDTDPEDVQIGRLAAVYAHVAWRAKLLNDELVMLPRPE